MGNQTAHLQKQIQTLRQLLYYRAFRDILPNNTIFQDTSMPTQHGSSKARVKIKYENLQRKFKYCANNSTPQWISILNITITSMPTQHGSNKVRVETK